MNFVTQGDGTEEVVACSWDGQTYIANLNRDVVRFQFQENVAAFYAGNIYKFIQECLSVEGQPSVSHEVPGVGVQAWEGSPSEQVV